MIRREQSFFGATQKEAEALAAAFVASTPNAKIFYSAPVWAPPIGKNNPKWQVDVEYSEEN